MDTTDYKAVEQYLAKRQIVVRNKKLLKKIAIFLNKPSLREFSNNKS